MRKILLIFFFISFSIAKTYTLILATLTIPYKIKYIANNIIKDINNTNNLILKNYKDKYYILLYKTNNKIKYQYLLKKYKAIPIKNPLELKNYLLLKIYKGYKITKTDLKGTFINDLYVYLQQKYPNTAKQKLNKYLQCYKNFKILKNNLLIVPQGCNYIFPIKVEKQLKTVSFKNKIIKTDPRFLEDFNKNYLIYNKKKKEKSFKNKKMKLTSLPFFEVKTVKNVPSEKVNKSKEKTKQSKIWLKNKKNISNIQFLNKEQNKTNIQRKNKIKVKLEKQKEKVILDFKTIPFFEDNKTNKIVITKSLENNKTMNIIDNLRTIKTKNPKNNKKISPPLTNIAKNNKKTNMDKNNIYIKKYKKKENTLIFSIIGIILILFSLLINVYYNRQKNKENYYKNLEDKKNLKNINNTIIIPEILPEEEIKPNNEYENILNKSINPKKYKYIKNVKTIKKIENS